MDTASTLSNNARDSAKDMRDGIREAGKATSSASSDIQSDLQALRDDFGRLAQEIGDILSNKGNAAWRRAKTGVDSVVSDARDKGREAGGAVRDVSDNLIGALDDSIRDRPYATLAIVAGLGFLLGAAWRR